MSFTILLTIIISNYHKKFKSLPPFQFPLPCLLFI